MANTVYDNFVLSNEIEDQYNSHLDLQTFCTVDNSLVGTAGMLRKVNVYKATDGTEKLAMGSGNTKSIEVGFTPREYRILLAQNRFKYYDEQAMTDPQLVPVGTKHMGTDMFNTVNADIYAEFAKATQVVVVTEFNFDAFADAQSVLALEDLEGVSIFAFVSPTDVAELRKKLKDSLQYVEAYAKNGYIGTVAGVNIYTKKDAVTGSIYMATAGRLMFHNVNGEVRILEDVDSLVTTSDTRGDVFKSNQTIRVCDQIANDAAVLFNTRYLGVVPNDAAGRTSLWNDICKLHQDLESIRALEDFDPETVTVVQGDTKKSVLCNIENLNIVNAMSQLYMSVIIA